MKANTITPYSNPERGALGCVMLAEDKDDAATIFEQLKPDYFRDEETKEIYGSIKRLLTTGQPVTFESLQFLHPDTLEGVDVCDWSPTHLQFPVFLDALQKRANPWLDDCEDAAHIVSQELPPVSPLVENLLCPETKFVIGGGSKSCKTWIAMHLALCIAHGRPFLGWQSRRSKVLFANLELRPAAFRRRVQSFSEKLGFEFETSAFTHLPLRGKLTSRLSTNIDRLIDAAQIHGAEVVVVDPCYKLNNADENSAHEQTALFNQLERLAESGCAVIIPDHFGKGSQSEKDPLDTLRGSSVKGGDLDSAMIMRPHEIDGHFRIDLIHRELPPVDPFVAKWEFPFMHRVDDLDPKRMKSTAGRTRRFSDADLLKAICDTTRDNPVSRSEWAKKVQGNRSTLTKYMTELQERRLTDTVGDGNNARVYITEKGLKKIS